MRAHARVIGIMWLWVGGCGGGGAGGADDDGVSCLADTDCGPGQMCGAKGRCVNPSDGRGGGGDGPVTPGGDPDILVSPTELDFGNPLIGVDVPMDLTVTNTGEGTLVIDTIDLIEPGALAEYAAAPVGDVGLEIPNGGTTIVTVRLRPADAEEDIGELVLRSNDPDQPDLSVPLLSQIKGEPQVCACALADLALDPTLPESCASLAALDFNGIAYGETEERLAAFYNCGTEQAPLVALDADVTDATEWSELFAATAFVLDGGVEVAPEWPLLLLPPSELAAPNVVHARVSFTAADDGGSLPAEFLRLTIEDEAAEEGVSLYDVPLIGVIDGCPEGMFDANASPIDGCELPCVPTGAETCDGEDNDCDGSVDEGSGCPSVCEVCNDVDDDCDGVIDEGDNACDGACELAQALGGPCDGADSDLCADDAIVCDGLNGTRCAEGADTPEICNEADDDCDGGIDTPGANGCGGACTLTPPTGGPCDGPDSDECLDDVYACDGANATTCSTGSGGAEICNGIDDDCDGGIDTPGPNGCGGACTVWPALGSSCDGPDTDMCVDDYFVCEGANGSICATGANNVEICNGADDDCTGGVDAPGTNGCGGVCEISALGTACDGPDAGSCADDTYVCSGANATFCSTSGDVLEVCGNGFDYDCGGGADSADAACQCAAGGGECGGSGGGCSCSGVCLATGDCCENACSVCGATSTFLAGGTDISGGTGVGIAGDTSSNAYPITAPVCAGSTVARTDWYRFTLFSPQMVSIDTLTGGGGSTAFDTVLSIHSGSCGASPLYCDDDSCDTTQSALAAHLTAGTYFVSVKPKTGDGGAYTLMYEPSACGAPTAGTLGSDLFPLEPPVGVATTTASSTCSRGDDWTFGCNSGANDVFYYFHGCPGRTLRASFCSGGGAGYDTVLGIFEGDTTCAGSGYCNDNFCGPASEVTSGVANRGLWYMIVDGYFGACGAYTLSYYWQ